MRPRIRLLALPQRATLLRPRRPTPLRSTPPRRRPPTNRDDAPLAPPHYSITHTSPRTQPQSRLNQGSASTRPAVVTPEHGSNLRRKQKSAKKMKREQRRAEKRMAEREQAQADEVRYCPPAPPPLSCLSPTDAWRGLGLHSSS